MIFLVKFGLFRLVGVMKRSLASDEQLPPPPDAFIRRPKNAREEGRIIGWVNNRLIQLLNDFDGTYYQVNLIRQRLIAFGMWFVTLQTIDQAKSAVQQVIQAITDRVLPDEYGDSYLTLATEGIPILSRIVRLLESIITALTENDVDPSLTIPGPERLAFSTDIRSLIIKAREIRTVLMVGFVADTTTAIRPTRLRNPQVFNTNIIGSISSIIGSVYT